MISAHSWKGRPNLAMPKAVRRCYEYLPCSQVNCLFRVWTLWDREGLLWYSCSYFQSPGLDDNFLPMHSPVLCFVTGFLSGLGQVVWSRIVMGLAHVCTVLTVGVEDAGMWLSVTLCFSPSICKLVYLCFSPHPCSSLSCALSNQFLVTRLCLLCICTNLSRGM